jgi:methionyl-tRNA formyltransferase
MRVVFITHNELGLACLEELADLGADVRAVYTRPETDDLSNQVGFEAFTDARDVPLHRVDSVNDEQVVSQIAGYEPELLFVVGWSQLVTRAVLDLPTVTALGMHPSPLPRGRGRAPLAWSLIKGLDETELSFFHLVEAADAGDLVGQEPIDIAIDDDAGSLYEKMVRAGRRLVRRHYPTFERGEVPREPQDDEVATWWPKRTPRHGLVDWNQPPMAVYNWIRGQTRPYPGAFSFLDGRKVKIWSAAPPTDERAFVKPGEIVTRDAEALAVGAWEGIVEITEVQVEGDDPVAASGLLDEYEFEIGDRFENARDCLSEPP